MISDSGTPVIEASRAASAGKASRLVSGRQTAMLYRGESIARMRPLRSAIVPRSEASAEAALGSGGEAAR